MPTLDHLLFPSFSSKNRPQKIHLLGVAGSGMSGLASLLLSLGHHISGSDRVSSREVEQLQREGLSFKLTQEAQDAHGIDLLVYSSAITLEHPTLAEALRLQIPTARRAEVLAALLSQKEGILISGMHGKTTTTSMAAHVMIEAEYAPSYYIGAEIPLLGRNAYWNPETNYFIAEGDESDGTLANYKPQHAIILNIEPEHLDFYPNLEAIDAVYQKLITQTAGNIFYWHDDPGAHRLCHNHPRAISVGSTSQADYSYRSLTQHGTDSTFEVLKKEEFLGTIHLNIPGKHHVANAMIVLTLSLELGVPFEKINYALRSFISAKRRFEIRYQNSSPGHELLLIDDYAHHPTEISATLATARTLLEKKEASQQLGKDQEQQTTAKTTKKANSGKLITLFQPHRYSRTAALYQDFAEALLQADEVILTDIYPASEKPLPGVTSDLILQAALQKVRASDHSSSPSPASPASLTSFTYLKNLEAIRPTIAKRLHPGDILLSLGAGNIHHELEKLAADLRVIEHLQAIVKKGVVKLYESMASHTTMRVGGPAQYWVEPATFQEAVEIVSLCHHHKIPIMIAGRGSNLIIRDGGIPGLVLHFGRGEFTQINIEGETITAGVGLRLKAISGAARQANLTGFEWMDGIPGNLGGSLRMNAGAMKKETWSQVEKIIYLDCQGKLHEATPADLEIAYRHVPFLKKNYVLSATLRGEKAPRAKIDQLLREAVDHRRTSQPLQHPSAGCIFKNPPGTSAGKLIDELGLKEKHFGGAEVSAIHGNFIINKEKATASDILTLIEKIKGEVFTQKGITLEREVQILGKEEEEPFPIYEIL